MRGARSTVRPGDKQRPPRRAHPLGPPRRAHPLGRWRSPTRWASPCTRTSRTCCRSMTGSRPGDARPSHRCTSWTARATTDAARTPTSLREPRESSLHRSSLGGVPPLYSVLRTFSYSVSDRIRVVYALVRPFSRPTTITSEKKFKAAQTAVKCPLLTPVIMVHVARLHPVL